MNTILSYISSPEISQKDLELCHPEGMEQKPPVSLQFLYKLTGLWFISVAAGSVLCSIPLSAIGLPIIITIGIFSLIITFIASMILKIWIYFIKLGWKTIKQVFYSPFTISSYILTKITSSLFGKSSIPPPILINQPLSRRFSSSTTRSLDSYHSHHSRLDSPRDFDQKYRYTDLDRNFDGIHRDGNKLDRDMKFEYREPPVHKVVNPVFCILDKGDRDRIEMCAQLYSLTTNIPMDKTGLIVGLEGGNLHTIVSLWNEPGVNEPLEVSHLIGFCQYFSGERKGVVHIDKLNVSSAYGDNGFSKRIIRKVMSMEGVDTIRVWSVWHAEGFYKSLGFKNAYEVSSGRRRKVERAHGPLLIWTRDNDSVSLKSKDSSLSLKGSGAFRQVI